MKDSYYFSHDANARNDEKILMLRAEFGWQAYGIYWALIEMMFESSETCLHWSKVKGIAVNCNIDITLLENIINFSIDEQLLVIEDDVFYSQSLRLRKEKLNELRQAKSNAGKKGMQSRYSSTNTNTVITPLQQRNNTDITDSNKGKETKEKKGDKGNDKNNTIKSMFSEFWNLYPKKTAKANAEKSFLKIKPSEELFAIIKKAVVEQSKSIGWQKDGGQYIPNPATWLNGERWNDEVRIQVETYEEKDYSDI